MNFEVKLFRSKESAPFHRYWQARFAPRLFGEHSPCEVRVRVYPAIGLGTPYLQEDERRGAYSVAAGWIPRVPAMLGDDHKKLYRAILATVGKGKHVQGDDAMIRVADVTGLVLSAAHRSLDLQVFHFGRLKDYRTRRGRVTKVGEFALHIQCPWRIVQPEWLGGSGDRRYPRAYDAKVDPEVPRSTRIDAKVEQLISERHRVESVEMNADGWLKIALSDRQALEILPDSHATEQWRLFVPGGDLDDQIVFPPEED